MSVERPGGLDPEEYKRLYRRHQREQAVDIIMDTDDSERERDPDAPPPPEFVDNGQK